MGLGINLGINNIVIDLLKVLEQRCSRIPRRQTTTCRLTRAHEAMRSCHLDSYFTCVNVLVHMRMSAREECLVEINFAVYFISKVSKIISI